MKNNNANNYNDNYYVDYNPDYDKNNDDNKEKISIIVQIITAIIKGLSVATIVFYRSTADDPLTGCKTRVIKPITPMAF